jgi:hypothetical protein
MTSSQPFEAASRASRGSIASAFRELRRCAGKRCSFCEWLPRIIDALPAPGLQMMHVFTNGFAGGVAQHLRSGSP